MLNCCMTETETPCCNENMEKCKTCAAPMWCMCTRPEAQEMVLRLWAKSSEAAAQ